VCTYLQNWDGTGRPDRLGYCGIDCRDNNYDSFIDLAGALLALGTISGALFFHFTSLGIVVIG
jgi:hypothetical protein